MDPAPGWHGNQNVYRRRAGGCPPPPLLGEDKLRGGGGVSDSQSVVMMNLLSDRQHGLTENTRANTAHRLTAA